MNQTTIRYITGVPYKYVPWMEITVRDNKGNEHPACVSWVGYMKENEFIRDDENGNIVEYLVGDEESFRYDENEHLDNIVTGFCVSYGLNDELFLCTEKGITRGIIIAEQNEEGLIEVQTELAYKGSNVNRFTCEQLDAIIAAKPVKPMVINESESDNEQQNKTENGKISEKKSLKDKIYSFLGCSFWILLLGYIVGNCVNDEIKDRRAKAREQFIKDSLAHDKHYQDSLAEARRQTDERWEQRRLWEKQHTLVIVRDSDRFYHTSTECNDVSINWLDREKADSIKMSDFRIILLQEAIDSGLKKCYECEEIYDKYLESFD